MSLSAVVTPPREPWPGAPATAVEAWRGRIPLIRPRWGFGDAWIALGGALVASLLAGLLVFAVPDTPWWQSTIILVSLVAQWVPMLGWPLFITSRKGNGARIDLGLAVVREDILWGIGGGIVVLCAAAAIGAATQAMYGEFSSSAGELLVQFEGQTAQLVVLALCIGIGAPIVEEICFRGLFWGALAKRGVGPWWCTLWTALAFSVFHLEPVRIPLLLVTGLLLGYLRQRTGRLAAPIMAHMVNNLAGVLTLFIGTSA